MGGRGSGSRLGGNGMDPSAILETYDLVSERERSQRLVDETLQAFKDAYDEYGYIVKQIQLAKLKPGKPQNVMAYYDGDNIAINETYFSDRIIDAYKDCVDAGFHPSNGSKTEVQALVAHEIGHALTDVAAKNMGIQSMYALHEAANQIVNDARKQTSHRGVVQMAGAISKYATKSNAETIAEAYSDVYCNGSKAAAESKAVVNELRKYLKNK